jgi:hypothetical protein
LQQLRDLAARCDGSVSVTDFRRTRNNALYAELLRRFGSIDAARERAGLIGRAGPYKWTRERIIVTLRDAQRAGVRITGPELRRAGKGDLLAAAEQHFGGLPRARVAAGIAPPPFLRAQPEEWTASRVAHVIRERHRRGESLASSRIPAGLRTAARVYCGGWKQAVEAAGFDYSTVRLIRERYSEEGLLAELARLARARPAMSITELHQTGLHRRCLEVFETLELALEQAGIDGWPRRSRRRLLSRKEALECLRRLQQSGRCLRRAAVRRADPHLVRSVDRNFESWEEALTAMDDNKHREVQSL